VEAQVAQEFLEELVQDPLESPPRIRILQDPPEFADRQGKISGQGPLERSHETLRQHLLKCAVIPQELLERSFEIVVHGLPDPLSLDHAPEPSLSGSHQGRLTFGGEKISDRSVPNSVDQTLDPPLHELLEAGRVKPAVEASGEEGGQLPEEPISLSAELRRKKVAQGSAFSLQGLAQKQGKPAVEGLSKLRAGEDAGEVCRREKSIADRAPDRLREAIPILRDGAVQEAEPDSRDFRRLIGVEEHPHRKRIGDPAGERAEGHGQERAKEFG